MVIPIIIAFILAFFSLASFHFLPAFIGLVIGLCSVTTGIVISSTVLKRSLGRLALICNIGVLVYYLTMLFRVVNYIIEG